MNTNTQRDYAPFPAACVDRGICRAVAYDLLNEGALETFKIGRKRYVYLDSLLTLDQRIERYNAQLRERRAQLRAERRERAPA
jgi:hypothetical protein